MLNVSISDIGTETCEHLFELNPNLRNTLRPIDDAISVRILGRKPEIFAAHPFREIEGFALKAIRLARSLKAPLRNFGRKRSF